MPKAQKRILMLGGSHFQVPAIQYARRAGHYTITCDYLPGNPGHQFTDEYHNVSTIDKEAVLALAEKSRIDGIVAYASDPAAPTAAFVSERLGLPGNPYESVEILANKDRFRAYLAEHGFPTPQAMAFSSLGDAQDALADFKLPVMVKPVDSSGSKGVARIDRAEDLAGAFERALPFSRQRRVIVEEVVRKKGYQIAGDGFVLSGELVFRCFANEHFNRTGNDLVPIGESFPYNQSDDRQQEVHDVVQRLLSLLGMQIGALNFDIRIDEDDRVVLMEVGPRNGGNLIPQVIHYATGVDMVQSTIEGALGNDCGDLRMRPVEGFFSCYMIHSRRAGKVRRIFIDPELERENVVEKDVWTAVGDTVPDFSGSNGTLGTLILRFRSMDEMLQKMDNMHDHVRVDTD